MTLIQIFAFLSVLTAFGVDQSTINTIHDVLIPPAATSTQVIITPVVLTPIEPGVPIIFGSTAPIIQPTPAPMPEETQPAAPAPEPFLLSRAMEISPGSYLRIYANHAFTVGVSSGQLGDVLVDNYPALNSFDQGGQTWTEHVYEYKLTGYTKPLNVTLTDADGQIITRTIK